MRREPEPYLQMHREAGTLGIEDGQRVQVSSRRGTIQLPVRLRESALPGMVYAPFHSIHQTLFSNHTGVRNALAISFGLGKISNCQVKGALGSAGSSGITSRIRNRDVVPQEIEARLNDLPFRPFRLFVSNGEAFDVLDPNQILVGLASITVAIPMPGGSEDDPLERSVNISLFHVVKIELIPSLGSDSQGPERKPSS